MECVESILRTLCGRQLPFLKSFNNPLNYAATGYRFLPFSFSVPHAVRTTCFTGKTTEARVRVLLCSLLNVFTPRVSSSKKNKRGINIIDLLQYFREDNLEALSHRTGFGLDLVGSESFELRYLDLIW